MLKIYLMNIGAKMRFRQYIEESAEMSGLKVARRVIHLGIDKFYNMLEKRDFNVNMDDMIDILDKSFGDTDEMSIYFTASPKMKGIGYHIITANTASNGDVEIEISKRLPKYMFTFKNKKESEFINNNRFLDELEDTIAHEYTHVYQYMRSLGFENAVPIDDYNKYMAAPDEIAAYATKVAAEVSRNGKSVILWVYESTFGPNHKVVKRLRKKAVDALKEIGYDVSGDTIKSDRPAGWKKVFKDIKRKGRKKK